MKRGMVLRAGFLAAGVGAAVAASSQVTAEPEDQVIAVHCINDVCLVPKVTLTKMAATANTALTRAEDYARMCGWGKGKRTDG